MGSLFKHRKVFSIPSLKESVPWSQLCEPVVLKVFLWSVWASHLISTKNLLEEWAPLLTTTSSGSHPKNSACIQSYKGDWAAGLSRPLYYARMHSMHSTSNYVNLRTSIWDHCFISLVCVYLWGVQTCVRVHGCQSWVLFLMRPSILLGRDSNMPGVC